MRISPEPHARSCEIIVHVAYVRGLVLLRYVDDRPHRLWGEGVMEVHSAAEV